MLPDKYCNEATNKPCLEAILHQSKHQMEHTMRRLLIASSLGLGLLSAGGLISSSFASSAGDHLAPRPTDRSALISPVNYDNHHSHYVPPARHWYRNAPQWHTQWHEHSQYHRPDSHHYSWR
jgi:hypothetical protein